MGKNQSNNQVLIPLKHFRISVLFLFSRVNFLKLQYNSLAFFAGFKRATDEGSLPEIALYSPNYLILNVLLLPKDQTFIFYTSRFIHYPVDNWKLTIVLHVAKAIGSLKRGLSSRNRDMAHFPFSLICSLLVKDLSFIFICYYCSLCCAVWRPLKVSPYIIHSADYIFLLVL